MPRPAWFEIYADWCLRSGRPASPWKAGVKGSGRPQLPMSASTVKDYLWRTKRLMTLTSPPYLVAVDGKSLTIYNVRSVSYKVVMDIRNVKPTELLSGIHKLFPEGITDEVAADYRHYKMALISLGRYLVYEMTDNHNRPVWSMEDLEQLRELLPSERVVYAKVEIMEPVLFDEFLAWLKKSKPARSEDPGYRELHDMAFALRWMGYRYSGARGASIKLDGRKTVKGGTTKYAKRVVTITEKPPNPTRSWEAPMIVAKFIAERRAYMAKTWPESKWLFCNTQGNQWHVGSSTFNRVLRKSFIRFHREVKGTDPDDVDLESCHAHALRHICGTYWIMIGATFPWVKNYLGHADYKTMEIYVGHVARLKGAAAMVDQMMDKWHKENGNNE